MPKRKQGNHRPIARRSPRVSKAADSESRLLQKPKRSVAAFDIPWTLLEQARDCVVALSGPPEHLTMSGLVVAALEREIVRLQKRYNMGRPFRRRTKPVRTGRPVLPR